MDDGGTNPRAPGERPRKGQCRINGQDVRDMSNQQVIAHLSLPWSANMSGKQRVWIAVYPPAEERRARARLPQFEALTLEASLGWIAVDLTRLLPEFLAAHKYRESIFQAHSPGAS